MPKAREDAAQLSKIMLTPAIVMVSCYREGGLAPITTTGFPSAPTHDAPVNRTLLLLATQMTRYMYSTTQPQQ